MTFAEMAAIHADVAKWQAAGERARDERLRREQDEAERLRLEALQHDADELHNGEGLQGVRHQRPVIPDNFLPAIAMTAPASAAISSHAGA